MSPDQKRYDAFAGELLALCEKHGTALLASSQEDDDNIYVVNAADASHWPDVLENDLRTPL